jgi:hypothetical protein
VTLPAWNTRAFGCLIRDQTQVRSLMRTQMSASLPAPFVSRSADQAAPLDLAFAIEMSNAEFRAWEQWFTYDLQDGSLPFTMFLPWGTQQPQVRCRLSDTWTAQRIDVSRWQVSGRIELEREFLPRFSGGAR